MLNTDIPVFQPRLEVISRDQALAIHSGALEILSQTGIKMQHPEVRQMLLDNGCIPGEGQWVKIPEQPVEKALASVPKKFILFDQMGNKAMDLSGDNFYYGTGSDTTFTRDLDTGVRRNTRLQDTANFARLVDGLPNISFAMSMSNPQDVPIEEIYVHNFAALVQNTNKPLVFLADNKNDLAKIYDLACAVAGGPDALRDRPFLLNYSEAISPLRFPAHVMDRLVFCAEKAIPICLPSGANAGGGAPVTLAGAMALGIAENLAGLVIHQMIAPGAPFLFAPNVSILDMKSSVVSYGCPEWSLTQAAMAKMRDEIYGIPVWAFAGATDSKVMDAQAGGESMFSIATAMLARCNLMHDAGYLEYGNTSCMEMVAMANEFIGLCRSFLRGIPVDADNLALEAIERVAKGEDGQIFLTDPHTFAHYRTAHFIPLLLDRKRWDTWLKNGKMDLYKRCNRHVRQILETHQPIPKPQSVLDEFKQILPGLT